MRISSSLSFWLVGVLVGHASTNAFSLSSSIFEDGDICEAEICGDIEFMNPAAIQYSALQASKPTRTTGRLTNALRLALGLPLNPPKSRRANGKSPPYYLK